MTARRAVPTLLALVGACVALWFLTRSVTCLGVRMPLFDLGLSGFTTEQDRAYCQSLVNQRLGYAVAALAVGVALALLSSWYMRNHESGAVADHQTVPS